MRRGLYRCGLTRVNKMPCPFPPRYGGLFFGGCLARYLFKPRRRSFCGIPELLRLSRGFLALCRSHSWRPCSLARSPFRPVYPGSFYAASAGEALDYARFYVLFGLHDGLFAYCVFLYSLCLFCPLGALYGGLNGYS